MSVSPVTAGLDDGTTKSIYNTNSQNHEMTVKGYVQGKFTAQGEERDPSSQFPLDVWVSAAPRETVASQQSTVKLCEERDPSSQFPLDVWVPAAKCQDSVRDIFPPGSGW